MVQSATDQNEVLESVRKRLIAYSPLGLLGCSIANSFSGWLQVLVVEERSDPVGQVDLLSVAHGAQTLPVQHVGCRSPTVGAVAVLAVPLERDGLGGRHSTLILAVPERLATVYRSEPLLL